VRRLDLERWLGRAPVGVLLADVDGTLLDFATYEAPPGVGEVIARLARAGVATVVTSSKTAAELAGVARVLPVAPLAVAEGGAVIADLGRAEAEALGPPRERLVTALAAARRRGWPVCGFADMGLDEVMRRTGLTREAAARAVQRLASEPFVLEPEPGPEEIARLVKELAADGLAVERGGRFYHLLGAGVDKGAGARRLLGLVDPRLPVLAAVGDAPNDLPMLTLARRGYLLGDAVADADLPPGIRRIPRRGPDGFLAAVADLLAAIGG